MSNPVSALQGAEYKGKRWLVAQAPVEISTLETGLIVLVQENYDSAAAPVRKLGAGVFRNGLLALLLLVAGVLYLWYLVSRALRDPNEAMRRKGGSAVLPSSLHSMETLEIPEKLRKRM